MKGSPLNASRALRRLGLPGALALLLMVAAAVVLLVSTGGLFAAIVTPGADAAGAADTRAREVETYAKALEGHRAQFDGRSLLFVPGPPPPPPAPAVGEDSGPPPAPPPPSEYKGPKLIGMVNGVAWFEDGNKLAPGESRGDMRLVSLDPPWDARIEWKGVTFTVSLFARDSVINHKGGGSAPEPAEPPAAPEPEKPVEEPKPATPPPPTDPPAPENRP